MSRELYNQIKELRKGGKPKEAWVIARKAIRDYRENDYIRSELFLTAYDLIKEIQKRIKERVDQNEQQKNYAPSDQELIEINTYLKAIEWLDLDNAQYGNTSHYRNLFLIFQRNLEHFPILAAFIFKYRNELFNEDDKSPFIPDNQTGKREIELPSLSLKFARKISASWLKYEEVSSVIGIDELCSMIENTKTNVRDKQHIIWLDLDLARCLVKAKKYQEARTPARRLLRKNKNKPYAWILLGDTFFDDKDASISLYSKAICSAKYDKEAIQAFIKIASLLAEKSLFDMASMSVKRPQKLYEDNGWKIRPEIKKLVEEPWFKKDVNIRELESYLEEMSTNSEKYLYGELQKVRAIVENIHDSGKGFHVFIDRDNSKFVPKRLLSSEQMPKEGDYIRLFLSDRSRIVKAEISDSEKIDDAENYEGMLKVTDNGYGFVDDVFVPQKLIKDDLSEIQVTGIKIRSFDKKKSKYGWKAITIEKAIK